jgi:transcriptional regulator with XRE-family HTH domain
MTDHEPSLYDLEMSTPQGHQGLSAARAAAEVVRILTDAKDQSKMSSGDLARTLNVSPGRVSQVLNGDGNVHVATLARFLDAMGFELLLDAKDDDEATLSSRRVHSRRPRKSTAVEMPQRVDVRWVYSATIDVVQVIATRIHIYREVEESLPARAQWAIEAPGLSADSYQAGIRELRDLDGSREMFDAYA